MQISKIKSYFGNPTFFLSKNVQQKHFCKTMHFYWSKLKKLHFRYNFLGHFETQVGLIFKIIIKFTLISYKSRSISRKKVTSY